PATAAEWWSNGPFPAGRNLRIPGRDVPGGTVPGLRFPYPDGAAGRADDPASCPFRRGCGRSQSPAVPDGHGQWRFHRPGSPGCRAGRQKLLPVPAVPCCASAVVLFAALAAAVAAVCLQPVPGLWPQQPDAAAPHWYRQQAVPVPVPALAVRQPQQLTVRLPVVAVPVSARL